VDSGLAAIIGASIGLIGSLIGTVLAPYVIRKQEQKAADERARRDALRRIIPQLMRYGTLVQASDTLDVPVVAEAMQWVGELNTWLTKDEWSIGRAATLAMLPDPPSVKTGISSKRFAALATALPAWMRQEITTEEAKRYFENVTGEKLTPLITEHSLRTTE
jgi:hypothetical protein